MRILIDAKADWTRPKGRGLRRTLMASMNPNWQMKCVSGKWKRTSKKGAGTKMDMNRAL